MLRRRAVTRLLVLGVATATTFGLMTTVASAAAFGLASSTPADKSIVSAAATVKLCFGATVDAATSTVTVTRAASVTGVTAPSNCTGTGDGLTFTPTATLADGDYTVNYNVNDTAVPTIHNTTGTIHFRVDSSAPTKPTIATYTHPVNSTNVTAVAVTGTTDPSTAATTNIGADTIAVTVDASVGAVHKTATVNADSSGNYSVTGLDLSTLGDGTVTYSVTAKDTAGNTSSAATQTATKDVVVPTLDSSSPAAGGTHQQTNTITLTFSKALDHATSSMSVANGVTTTLLGVTSFPSADVMALTTNSAMKEAGNPYTVSYTGTDADGNPRTGQFTFTIDDTAPASPSALVPTDPINMATASAVGLSGSAESGSRVDVDFTDGTHHATGHSDASNGSFAVTGIVASGLNDGQITVNATATDAAGNVSDIASTTVTKDTAAPAQPTAVVIAPDPINKTNETSVTVTATVAADVATATISIDDANANTPARMMSGVVPDGSHQVSATFDVSTLDDGTLTASVYAVDAAANPSSTATKTATKDAGVPAAPSVAISPKPINASTTTVTVSGVAEKSSAVHIVLDDTDSNVAPLTFDTTANATTGAYTHDFSVGTLADGTITATVTATDAAANTSAPGTDSTAKDAVAPDKPANLSAPVYANIANSAAYPVSGTAEPDSTVTVTFSDGSAHSFQVATTAAHADGSWAVNGNLTSHSFADGALHLSITATDAVGNISAATTADRTKDTVAPAAARIDSYTHPVDANNDDAVGVSGTAGATESGAGLMLSIDDANDPDTAPVTATTTAANDGSYSFSGIDVSGLDDGQLTITLSVTDVAGNPAATTTQVTAAKDTIDLALLSYTPASSSTKSPAAVTGTFNEPLDPNTSTITVADKTDSLAAGTTTFDDANKRIVFTPSSPLSEAGSPFTVTITGHDAAGDSPTPTVFEFTVDNTPPAKPVVSTVTNPINASNFTAVAASGTAEKNSSVAVTFSDGTHQLFHTVSADSNGDWSVTGMDLTDLSDGTITVTAIATDAAGNSSVASDPVTTPKHTVVPSAPQSLTAAPGNGTLDISWVAPATDGGSAVTSYTLTVTPDGSPTPVATANPGAGTTEVVVSSLTNGTLYDVAVTATNAAGTGPAATGSGTPRTLAGAPTAIHASAGDASATVSWTAPVSDGGAAIDHYTVHATPASSGPPTVTAGTADGTARSLTIHGLTNGFVYTFTVTAHNAAGNGPASAAVSGTPKYKTTLTIHDTHSAVVYGNKVTLSGKLTRSNGAGISGAPILVYRINDNNTTNHVGTLSSSSTGTWTYTFTPAVDGTYYARYLGNQANASTGSTKARTTVAPVVKITSPASNSSTSQTTTLSVKGTVGPNMTGKYVSLNYVNSSGSLVRLQLVKLTTGSVFAFAVKLARGTWRLEVVIGPTANNVAGHSAVLTVTRT